MNKKLMAVAVAGALSAPGFALAQVQSSPGVTLYGVLDLAIWNAKYTADTKAGLNLASGTGELKKGEMFSTAPRMGVRGREDLGGGTSAWFQLETNITLNGRNDPGNLPAQVFGGRPSAIGLTNTWGDVMWGIWDSPYKVVTDQTYNLINSGPFSSSGAIMGNGDTTGSTPNSTCTASDGNGGAQTAKAVCFPEITGNATSFHRRLNDTVQYWSPVMSGLQFKIATEIDPYQSPGQIPTGGLAPAAVAQPSGTSKPKLWSGNVTWARGPILLAAGYETHTGYNPGTTVGVGNPNPKDNAWQIGGKWDFGPGQIGLGYERISYGDNGLAGNLSSKMDVSSYQADVKWTLGPGAIWGQYSATPGGKTCNDSTAAQQAAGTFQTVGSAACGGAGKAKWYALGYDYILSKRTKVYFAYNKIDNGAGTTYYYAAPSVAANGNGGTTATLTAGTDVTVIAVGMVHSF
jgi:predicted porin